MIDILTLLRYKTEVTLVDPRNNENLGKVWVKLLGDDDIKEAYKYARVVSADMRAKLRDKTSIDYKIQIQSLEEQDDKDLYDLIVAANVADFTRESIAVVAREELPKLEEVAVEPDAPKLEDQEKLDAAEKEQENRFEKAINKYVDERREPMEAELKKVKRAELIKQATEKIVDLIPSQEFMNALNDQKIFRGTFVDAACKQRAIPTIEQLGELSPPIKEQILYVYNKLEVSPDDIKK